MPLTKNKKSFLGNLIILLFILFVSITCYLTEIFQISNNKKNSQITNSKLFTALDLNKIELKNINGEFKFQLGTVKDNTNWSMTSPKSGPANSIYLERLLSFLRTANIKKIYSNDKINNSLFSIEKPTATLSLYLTNNSIVQINFGLLNTIDNSIYLRLSNQNFIYHVSAPEISLENANLIDLIEPQIFSINTKTIQKIIIHNGTKKSPVTLEISKNNNLWLSSNGKAINPAKLATYLQDLSILKSSFIIEKLTENQKRRVQALKIGPQYTLITEDSKNELIEYSISSFIKDFPEIELKNEPHFIITTSLNNNVYIMGKELFDIFDSKIEKLY